MSDEYEFRTERQKRILSYNSNVCFQKLSRDWLQAAMSEQYVYNFDWLGRPIIQLPNDVVNLQEIIFEQKPDLIVETGVARGGSVIFYASILALLDYADAKKTSQYINPERPNRMVVGIDVDIRQHNRDAIESHFLSDRIRLIEGSSTDKDVLSSVTEYAKSFERVMVILDSNHTHDHVLEELSLYSQIITPGQYCVVLDTLIEDMPLGFFKDRPWNVGNNPKTAIKEFLGNNSNFVSDYTMDDKLMISSARGGYLKRVG